MYKKYPVFIRCCLNHPGIILIAIHVFVECSIWKVTLRRRHFVFMFTLRFISSYIAVLRLKCVSFAHCYDNYINRKEFFDEIVDCDYLLSSQVMVPVNRPGSCFNPLLNIGMGTSSALQIMYTLQVHHML